MGYSRKQRDSYLELKKAIAQIYLKAKSDPLIKKAIIDIGRTKKENRYGITEINDSFAYNTLVDSTLSTFLNRHLTLTFQKHMCASILAHISAAKDHSCSFLCLDDQSSSDLSLAQRFTTPGIVANACINSYTDDRFYFQKGYKNVANPRKRNSGFHSATSHFIKYLGNMSTCIQTSSNHKLSDRIGFGKYKSSTYGEIVYIDHEYLFWIDNNVDRIVLDHTVLLAANDKNRWNSFTGRDKLGSYLYHQKKELAIN